MHGATGFLDSFVEDEIDCRCLSEKAFGGPIDNAENDVPLYDMYNRGLVACQEGLERNPLTLEGGRPGLTGYIPSMEHGIQMGASPNSKSLLLDLGAPPKEMINESLKRRGLLR